MTRSGLALFDTPIGGCAIAWRGGGLIGAQLPEGDDARTLARLKRRFPDLTEAEPPAEARAVIEQIRALLGGARVDLSAPPLDLTDVSPFEQKVYEIARRIPAGRVMTYGEIAERLGDKLLARDIGQAMGRNPFPIVIPCHRVVAANGKLGGFSARGGAATKARLLAIEGYAPGGQPSLL